MSALPPKADIEASLSRQDDFQNCCGSDTPASNFYTRLRCPTHSQVWFAKDEGSGVSNEIADENASPCAWRLRAFLQSFGGENSDGLCCGICRQKARYYRNRLIEE